MTSRIKTRHHPHAALPDEGDASLISNARLIEIYAAMLRCRMFRERIRSLAGPARLRTLAPGSEAVTASAVIGLLPEDTVVSAAPHLLAALTKGVPLTRLVPLLTSPRSASNSGLEPALAAAGIFAADHAGSAVAHLAAGAAFAGKLGNRLNVTLVFHQDTGGDPGWREVFNLALVHDLPLIFIRQAAAPLEATSRRKLRRSAKGPGASVPVIPVDRNDAVAVYRVVCEAIAHARRGSGPTLLDCVSLHFPGERKNHSDCLVRMEHYLAAKGLRPERIQAAVAAKFARALDKAASAGRTPRAGRKSRRLD